MTQGVWVVALGILFTGVLSFWSSGDSFFCGDELMMVTP